LPWLCFARLVRCAPAIVRPLWPLSPRVFAASAATVRAIGAAGTTDTERRGFDLRECFVLHICVVITLPVMVFWDWFALHGVMLMI